MRAMEHIGSCVYAPAVDGRVLIDDGVSGLAILKGQKASNIDAAHDAIMGLGDDRTCDQIADLFDDYTEIEN